MARILLAAVNAKYIHSNLGIYSLKAYAQEYARRHGTKQKAGTDSMAEDGKMCETDTMFPEILIGEYTINQQTEQILRDIYEKKPDMVGFSCYIWNISYVMELIGDLHKVLPKTDIWLGGPEVSYDAVEFLHREKQVCGIMCGEGEEMFARVAEGYGTWFKKERAFGEERKFKKEIPFEKETSCEKENWRDIAFAGIPGVVFRDSKGNIIENQPQSCLDMNQIPFSYHNLNDFENRIIYYESSRGCPFSCSYCLSSIDKRVRFRDMALVLRELDFFLEKKVPQVKFVDRTFNCRKSHAMAIWRHILEHDNGITNFHFEISADLLDEEELELLGKMRPGLVQLEIGVQSTNSDTIREIHRTMNLQRLKEVVKKVNEFHNIHQHLDLIAGLPFEGIESFARSFDEVYAMEPEQLQLGFLKVLKGSAMMERKDEYGILYQERPPYEVLSTKWLSYEDILRLKGIEDMVEVYYNSRQFEKTIKQLQQEFSGAFVMYDEMAAFYKRNHLTGISHSRLARFEILYQFICETCKEDTLLSVFRDCLMVDLYLRENAKSRPSFASDRARLKTQLRDFFIREAENPKYLRGYEGYDSKQVAKMAHAEVLEDGRVLLFDYKNRDALNYNAACWDITDEIQIRM